MSAMHSSNIHTGQNVPNPGGAADFGYSRSSQSKDIAAVSVRPNRHLMDPEIQARKERNMISNVNSAVMGQEKGSNPAATKDSKLTAAAVLFDENHPRGMKNTAIRHVSPDPTAAHGNRPKTSGDYGQRYRESKSNERLPSGITGGGGLGGANRSLGRS